MASPFPISLPNPIPIQPIFFTFHLQSYEVKNPGPQDLALSLPQRRPFESFLDAGVSWSNGVVDHCKITNPKHQVSGFQVSGVNVEDSGVRCQVSGKRNMGAET
jgi:hypothetical protein